MVPELGEPFARNTVPCTVVVLTLCASAAIASDIHARHIPKPLTAQICRIRIRLIRDNSFWLLQKNGPWPVQLIVVNDLHWKAVCEMLVRDVLVGRVLVGL